MTKCATPTVSGCHMNSCMLSLAGPYKAGERSLTVCMAGHSSRRHEVSHLAKRHVPTIWL